MIKSFWGNNIRSFFLVVDFLCQIVKACKLIVNWANIQKIDQFLTQLKMMMCVQKQLPPRTKANRVRRGQTAFFSRGASSPVLLGDVGRESRSGFMFILDMLMNSCGQCIDSVKLTSTIVQIVIKRMYNFYLKTESQTRNVLNVLCVWTQPSSKDVL